MARQATEAERFEEYLGRLMRVVGHADQHHPLRVYVTGLLLHGERKSVEPVAAKTERRPVRARHQSMHHFVANAPWEASEVIAAAQDYLLSQLERRGPVQAWVANDTGIRKKGRVRSEWRRGTAANSGSRRTARWW